jgi:hypothetical protein
MEDDLAPSKGIECYADSVESEANRLQHLAELDGQGILRK